MIAYYLLNLSYNDIETFLEYSSFDTSHLFRIISLKMESCQWLDSLNLWSWWVHPETQFYSIYQAPGKLSKVTIARIFLWFIIKYN